MGVGERSMYYPPIGDTAFRALIESSPNKIIYRKCLYCHNTHRDIYYKRLTDLPEESEVDFLDLFMNNWSDTPSNVMGDDFKLFSSYEDALADVGNWTFCNYNDPRIGFPRDCGPTGSRGNQWNSYVRGGAQADHHQFYVEKSAVDQTA